MTANSRSSRSRSASSPERAVTTFCPKLLEDGLEDQQLLRQVVHDQDVDLLVIGHAVDVFTSASSGALRVAAGRSRQAMQTVLA